MSQNYAWVKDPFKINDKQMDFNATKYRKFIDMVSDSTLQPTFKKPPFVV